MKPMLPIENYFGKLELVYAFYGTMPTGVSVSETGRIFICFPKWGDDVKFTVAEIVEDKLQPYPNLQTNLVNPGKYLHHLDHQVSMIILKNVG